MSYYITIPHIAKGLGVIFMALKIRLRKQGRNNRASYRVVVADSRSPRDGKYVEKLGWYDPCENKGPDMFFDEERIQYWLSQGAEPSENIQFLLKKAAPALLKAYKDKIEAQKVRQREKRRATKQA